MGIRFLLVISFVFLGKFSFARKPSDDFSVPNYASTSVYYKPSLTLSEYKCLPEEETEILNEDDDLIIKVCKLVYDKCLMQGGCVLTTDDQVLNLSYYGLIDGRHRFQKNSWKKCIYGFGVDNICLDPFYSIAADEDRYDLGDVIFVPDVVGMMLPNGELHNGFFIVRDRGTAIKGIGRFDFFTGYLRFGNTKNPFSILGLDKRGNKFPYFRVEGYTAERIRKIRNYPNLPTVNVRSGEQPHLLFSQPNIETEIWD